MDTAYYLNLAFNGVVEGSIYALGALSITLVFGIARFPNAATGDVMTVGAFGGLAGTTLGNLNAIAMEPMGHIAGMAASVGELVLGVPCEAHESHCTGAGADTCVFRVESRAA